MVTISRRSTGTYVNNSVTGETVRAFVPSPLPPSPALDITQLYHSLDRANQELGRLDGLATLLPARLFLFLCSTLSRQQRPLLGEKPRGQRSLIS